MKLTYAEWKKKVDAAISAKCGLTSDDLADYNYADAYADGVSPSSAARKALAAEGFGRED